MGLTDFSTGVQGGLQALIAQRIKAQMLADSLKQQEFQNARQTQGDARAQQQLDATIEGNTFNRERQGRIDDSLMQDRLAGQAKDAADTIPSETWMQGGDPAATTMQKGGYGALLTPTKPTQAMGPAFEGPMGDGETPQQAQVGRSGGFLKTASQAQMKEAAAQRDKQTDNDRQAARDSSTEQYQRDSLDVQRRNADANMYRATHPASAAAAAAAPTEQQKNEVADSLTLIDQISNDSALDAAVGPLDAYIGKTRDLSGVNRFEALHNELVGKLQLAQAGKLKGQGQISNMEREMLRGAATALTRKMSEQDYRAELAKIRAQFERMSSPIAPAASHGSTPTAPAAAQAPPKAAPSGQTDYRKKYGY